MSKHSKAKTLALQKKKGKGKFPQGNKKEPEGEKEERKTEKDEAKED